MNARRVAPYAVVVFIYGAFFLVYRAIVPAMEEGYRGPSAEFRRVARLNDEARQLVEALREVMLRDSILPLIPTAPGIVTLLPDSDNAQTEYLRRVAQREVQRDVDVAIPIFGVPSSYALSSDFPMGLSSARYYAGDRASGAPYCAVVVPLSNSRPQHRAISGSILGPCGVWARHGAAGPHIEEWMRNTRGAFASNETSRMVGDYSELFAEIPYARRFGSQFWGSFESRRCRAGDRAACERAVISADSSRGMPAGIAMTADRWYMPRVAPGDAGLLEDLEEQFGRERFRRFWKSPEPVGKAFEAAFGLALGQWVHDWSEARYGPITVGSRMKLETILLSLIFIGLFTALAVATVRGRRI
jgi:hypothetical protein